jgi:hypothetical protein
MGNVTLELYAQQDDSDLIEGASTSNNRVEVLNSFPCPQADTMYTFQFNGNIIYDARSNIAIKYKGNNNQDISFILELDLNIPV